MPMPAKNHPQRQGFFRPQPRRVSALLPQFHQPPRSDERRHHRPPRGADTGSGSGLAQLGGGFDNKWHTGVTRKRYRSGRRRGRAAMLQLAENDSGHEERKKKPPSANHLEGQKKKKKKKKK
jgi:hypothetical protein